MRIFDNPELLREVMGSHKKWQRTLEAVDTAPSLDAGVVYSIGDSLTYRRCRTHELATDQFIGRRRYHLVVAAIGGDVAVEVMPKADGSPASPYSDLSDQESFDGSGKLVTVPEGGLLLLDIDEAARVLFTPDSEAVALHVTVEGATFHNK